VTALSPLLWLLVALAAALAALAVLTRMLVARGRRRAPMLGTRIEAGGAALHYVERGAGLPVVFLHGAKGSAYDALLSVGPGLERDYRLLAFDRPGSGYSGRLPRGNGSPRAQAEAIHEALRQLDALPAVLVAHSAGAGVALAMALDHAPDVAGVVTLGGYLFPARDPDHTPGRVLSQPLIGPLLRATVVVPFGALIAPLVLRRVFFPAPVDARYAGVAPGLALQPQSLAGDALDLRDYEAGLRELTGRYADGTVPVVAVHGLADYVVSGAQAVRFAQLWAPTRLELLEDVGHLPHFAAPQAVLQAVAEAWETAVVHV
jgi:pimeloyl-ACP methyl ester carboxylesterase